MRLCEELGAGADRLPDGATVINEDSGTYYQFDTVFFQEATDEDGIRYYEVVAPPDGSEVVALEE